MLVELRDGCTDQENPYLQYFVGRPGNPDGSAVRATVVHGSAQQHVDRTPVNRAMWNVGFPYDFD